MLAIALHHDRVETARLEVQQVVDLAEAAAIDVERAATLQGSVLNNKNVTSATKLAILREIAPLVLKQSACSDPELCID